MTTIKIQPPMIEVPEGEFCGQCPKRLGGYYCTTWDAYVYYHKDGLPGGELKCPACIAACEAAKEEK